MIHLTNAKWNYAVNIDKTESNSVPAHLISYNMPWYSFSSDKIFACISMLPNYSSVADHLALRAKGLKDEEADAFGRSAFNRYYYASYLTVRELLGAMDAAWETVSHATISSLLEGAVLLKLKKEAKKQEKSGLISKNTEKGLIHKASTASSEIASMLKIAYGVRVISDYKPDVKIIFTASEFRVDEHSDIEAKNWKPRIEQHKGVLIRISKELGIV